MFIKNNTMLLYKPILRCELRSLNVTMTPSIYTPLWDWSWQLCDCELCRLRCIDRIVTNFCRKKKCALLFLHKDWLTKHTSYTRSHKELSVLVNQSELTVIFSLYVLHSCDIYAADSLLKKLLCKKKNSE